VLTRTGATVALVRGRRLEDLLDLRWRPPALRDLVCLDETASPRPPAESVDSEDVRALFDYISESAVDRVTAGGFVSAFTGEPFSEAEVDEYRDRVLGLAGPWLRPGARVLEVGCGSGLVFWEVVERTGPSEGIVGIDPSPRTQEVNRERAEREGLSGVTLLTGFAHEIDALLPPETTAPFDLVIVASTVQFFPGPLYLEDVMARLTRRLVPGGALVVADVPDARRRGELREELEARCAERAGDALGDLLFVDEALFADFGRAAVDLDRVEVHHRTGPGAGFDNELRFRYDVLIVAAEEEHAGRTRGDGHGGAMQRRSRLWTGWHVERCPSDPDRLGPPVTGPDDIAYVIFTSGSTGEPKGIVVRHRPAVQLALWVNRTFGVGPDDRLLFVTSLSFDLSVYDLFGTLSAGATVRIASSEELEDPDLLVRVLVEEPITIWDSAPAALQRLAPLFPATASSAPGGGRDHLRLVMLSGDWIPLPLPDRVRDAFPGARVVSLGGATEATVWSNWFPKAD
jgi:SAM-dependent methyltransferase